MRGIELVQFRFSHYNEKARWALDHKQVPHRRRSLLPGPHVPVVKKLTGATQVPVLRTDDRTIAGSAAIIDWLETNFPGRPLLPSRPEWRTRALEIQRWFDDEIGPESRRALFLDLLQDGPYAARCFSQGFGAVARAAYRLAFPITRIVMRGAMELDPARREATLAVVRRALDFVAETAGPHGFLVGDRFSVADLTAAALLQMVAFPPQLPTGLPEPRSPVIAAWLRRWADHPGARWVEAIYRDHRPPSAELPA